MTSPTARIECCGVDVVRPLRNSVLRPDRPDDGDYPGDDRLDAAHVAAFVGDEILAVGTIFPERPPWDPDRTDGWHVRGMATRSDARGRGLGARVLESLLAHARSRGGGLAWCEARVGSPGFYERSGFISRGDAFEMEGIDHIVMTREL